MTPLFYDSSSGKSILNAWKPSETKTTGSQSFIQMIKDENANRAVFVSKNFATFLEAWKNVKSETKAHFSFGLELIMCDDAKVQTPESRFNEHKIIIFLKKAAGYSDLLKIYSACHSDLTNKYYIHRFDYKQLKKLWTDNLVMALPFFDSFVAKNTLSFGTAIVPDLSFTKPLILRELATGLPVEEMINKALDRFNADKTLPEENVKSIYYKNRKDFKAYMTYRAILKGTSFKDPNMEDMSSEEFCWESYLEVKNK